MGSRSPRDKHVALIGYGLGGAAFHAPLIDVTPGLRLACIVTSNPERQREARQRYPDARVLESADQLWQHAAEIHLVVISTPNRSHVPLALAALNAGLPVVVDKPIATSSADARRLVSEAEHRRLLLTVYQNRRYDGDFFTLRRLLNENTLGVVLRFESRFERWRLTPKAGWREHADPDDAGGLLFDLGSHLIDQALVLFGPVTHVYAELDRRRPGVHVDDDVFVALAHASGVRSHLYMTVLAADRGPRLRVLGDRGAYTKFGMDPQEEALRRGERPEGAAWGVEPPEQWGTLTVPDRSERVPTERGAYQDFYAGVAASLATGAPPPVDPRDAIATLEIIEAARRSSVEHTVVPLAP